MAATRPWRTTSGKTQRRAAPERFTLPVRNSKLGSILPPPFPHPLSLTTATLRRPPRYRDRGNFGPRSHGRSGVPSAPCSAVSSSGAATTITPISQREISRTHTHFQVIIRVSHSLSILTAGNDPVCRLRKFSIHHLFIIFNPLLSLLSIKIANEKTTRYAHVFHAHGRGGNNYRS